MAWEERSGRPYYYRSRRVGGRVLKEYVGAGPAAELMADVEEAARQAERARRETEKAERERLEAFDREIDAVCETIELVARAALVEAGYRQHNRGEWRLRHARGEAGGTQDAREEG